MKRILPLILCLSLLLGLFCGCAAENTAYTPTGDALMPEDADLTATAPKDESIPQELTLAYYPDRELNPFRSTDFTNRVLFSLIYQGLFAYNSNYEPIPILCGSYRASSSGRTYTFYLDSSATFSDGTPVTNADVLASIEAAKSSKYYGGRFTHVAEVAETDDGGISFQLRLSIEDFPILLDFPIIKASQIEADKPLGTGPYILENSLAGAQLRRSAAWWCESPDLIVTASSITLTPATSTTQIRDEFEFSDVGLVLTDPCSDTYADYRCDYELWDCDNGSMMYLACNVGYSQDDIFASDTLRKGLTYAIARDKIVAEHFNGFGRPATLAMDPGYPYYSESLAMKYKLTFDNLKDCTGSDFKAIHMVGGGTKDGFLCQMTSDATGVPVVAGPIEATAAGNVAVQLIAAGEIKDLAEARKIIADSFAVVKYEPKDSGFAEAYERFLGILQ